MAGVRLTGDWRKADKALSGLSDRSLFGRIHKVIAEYGVSSTKERFQTEKDPQGNRWIPSDRVIEKGGKTLTDTARLRKSITGKGTASRAMWGTNVVYAARHNFGDTIVRGRRSGGIVRRQFMGLNKEDQEEIMEIIQEILTEAGVT